jgi:hypothetical protein
LFPKHTLHLLQLLVALLSLWLLEISAKLIFFIAEMEYIVAGGAIFGGKTPGNRIDDDDAVAANSMLTSGGGIMDNYG